jgi:hypothetical protein
VSATEKKKEKYERRLWLNAFQLAGQFGMVPFYRDINGIAKDAIRKSEAEAEAKVAGPMKKKSVKDVWK